VRIHDHRRIELAHQLRLRLRLGRAQQQVVAVHVDAARREAPACRRAVGVRARQDHDIDAIEQRRQAAARELLRNDQQGLAAGRLVSVLLGNQQNRRPARAIGDLVLGNGPAEMQRFERNPGLRTARLHQPHRGRIGSAAVTATLRASHQGRHRSAYFGVAAEAGTAGLERRGLIAHGRLRKAGRNRRAFGSRRRLRGIHSAASGRYHQRRDDRGRRRRWRRWPRRPRRRDDRRHDRHSVATRWRATRRTERRRGNQPGAWAEPAAGRRGGK